MTKHSNLPISVTAFRAELTKLRKALKQRFGSSFHHAEYGDRSSPDNRADSHNLFREELDADYHEQCGLHDILHLDELLHANMHGPVVLDLYVYEFCGFNDWSLATNEYAYFLDGRFIGLASGVGRTDENDVMLSRIQRAA